MPRAIGSAQFWAGTSLEQQIIGFLCEIVDTPRSKHYAQAISWLQQNTPPNGQRNRAANTRLLVACKRCEAVFVKSNADVSKAARRGHTDLYCSLECSTADHAVKNRKPCANCGTPLENRHNKYCTPCLGMARVTKRVPKRECPECKDWFWPQSERRAYCSRVCADRAHSTRMLGAGNSRYKDGQSYATWFRLARPLVLERDKFACVACGVAEEVEDAKPQPRSNMRIHHINEQPADNRAENLVTLCKTCHAVHHKSSVTPFNWLSDYATRRSASMTSKWQERATSLQERYSSTTVLS